MKSMLWKHKEHLLLFVILIWVFALIWVLNVMTPWLADDYWFRQRNAYGLSLIQLFFDSIRMANERYFTHEGAWFDSFFAHLIIHHSRLVSASINAVLTVAMLMAAFSILRRFMGNLLGLLITLLIPLTMPKPYQTLVWIAATEHYLWPMFFGLVVIVLAMYKKQVPSWGVWLVGIPFSLFVGMAHGAMGGVFFLLLLGHILHRKIIENGNIPIWMWASLGIMFVGMVTMALAPGNYARLSLSHAGEPGTWTDSFSRRFILNIFALFPYYTPGICISGGMLACALSKRGWRDADVSYSIIWGVSGIAGLFALLLPPVSIRATSFLPVCLLMTLAYSVKALDIVPKNNWCQIGLLLIVTVLFSLAYASRISQARVIRRFALQREQILEKASKEGKKSVRVISFIGWKLFAEHTGMLGDLERPGSENNAGLEKFYGIDEIHTQDWAHAQGILE